MPIQQTRKKTQKDNLDMNNSKPSKLLSTTEIVALSLKKTPQKKEKRFKNLGLLAVLFGFMLVLVLISDITIKALPAFGQHWVQLDIDYKSDWLNIEETSPETLLAEQLKKLQTFAKF